MGLKLFELISPNFSVEILHGDSLCIPIEPGAPPLGCGAVSGA